MSRDLELQREKLIELKVKEKVEFEVAQKLEEERVKREEEERKHREQAEKKRISTLKHERKTNYKSKGSLLDNFSSSSKSSGKIDNSLIKRRSLDVVRTSGERVRTPVRKSMEAAEIGMAAQLAWSQSQNGANHSKVSNNRYAFK